MKAKFKTLCSAAAVIAAGSIAIAPVWGGEKEKTEGATEEATEANPAKEVPDAAASENDPREARAEVPPPKPISDKVRTGLAYLAEIQNADGGWGQGGGWRKNPEGSGRIRDDQAEDRSDVGNTCIAISAFLRAGHELRTGQYAEQLRKGTEYVLKQIEKADDTSLFVTQVRDTQLQSKIGVYVDTFLAAQLLANLHEKMPTPELEVRRTEMLDKVVAKIAANQQQNGAFAGNQGWASTLSQGICSRALNDARLAGCVKVTDEVLERDNKQNLNGLDVQKRQFAAGDVDGATSSAGVALYNSSSKLRGIWQNSVVNQERAREFTAVVNSPAADPAEKEKAQEELKKIEVAEVAKDAAQEAVVASVQNDAFVKGFGNNGGEEFLSYMNIGESLRLAGGKNWTDWDQKMTVTINDAQNEDGSWSGHHCITGRTFCTAGALLTLMADRAPLPDPAEEAASIEKPLKETAKVAE